MSKLSHSNDATMCQIEARGRLIVTDYDPKPIPTRAFDWTATFDDYDAEVVDGEWVSKCPIGHGATEADAKADLLSQADDEDDAPSCPCDSEKSIDPHCAAARECARGEDR